MAAATAFGNPSGAQQRRPDMEHDQPARDVGAENPDVQQCDDYEYDEAHDLGIR